MKRAAAATLLVAAASGCPGGSGRSGGDLRPLEILVPNDAETLDPRYSSDAVAVRATRLIHAGLVRLDPTTLVPVPYLAKSWTWLDATTLRIDLREDVRFHSGAPLEAADVVATLRAFASPRVASRHASVVDAILSAREEGEHAVIVTLRRPHATLITDLELPVLRRDQAESPADPDGALDGLGPYVVARFARGEISLSPAEHAALPRPAHALVIRTVHDENARAVRLEAGRADVAVNAISPTLLPELAGRRDLVVASRPGANLTYAVMRVDRGALADVNVRRAISLGIDRAGIARTLLAGHAVPADTLIPPAHWAYTPAEAPFLYDPAASRQALTLAGFQRLRLTLLTSTDRLRGTIARFIAQELDEVGIDLEVIPLELGTMMARLSAGDFDMATLQLPELAEPNVLRVFLSSAFVPPRGSNRGRIADPVLDALLEEGDRIAGEDARRLVYERVEARMRDELYWIPLWHEDQVSVASVRARAFLPSAEGRWLSLALLP